MKRPGGLAPATFVPRVRAGWPCLAAAISLGLGGCEADSSPPERFALERAGRAAAPAECAERTPLRRALFGDLHVHTTLSSDAWNYDLEVRPSDAYAYAFGDPIRLPPNDASGKGTREVRIDRPLDFAAVTDHSEFLGELALCRDPASEVYSAEPCALLRASTVPADNPQSLTIMTPWPKREDEICGENAARCDAAQLGAWHEILAAAERWNDASATCARTTFVGWEYSSHRLGSNLHRNVIFKTNLVPSRPISYLDAPREWKLWELLEEVCREGDAGCDVLAIPHNSNISNGRMFAIDYAATNGRAAERERAALRARLEPVVEIMQHKGDSECRAEMPGVVANADELCHFEKFEDTTWRGEVPGECGDFLGDLRPRLGAACLSHRSYVRYVVTEGLAEERRLGVNPFKLGFIASTDTHNGLAGGVAERDWPGHLGIADADPKRRLSEEPGLMGNMANGPGGLAGVYAEENSRAAIFEAIQRRETFGTSGPRIEPRFFAAADLPDDLCAQADRLALADAAGVPMGGDLVLHRAPTDTPAAARGPAFAVFASADPGTADFPGGDLERIQVVKGWVDGAGTLHEEVVDVAGGPNGATVDPATCRVSGGGARELCGVWRDADYDPALGAVYYARVLESPSCRFSAWQCNALPESERPPGCRHEHNRPIQQERAWTSPIWVSSAPAPADSPEGEPRS